MLFRTVAEVMNKLQTAETLLADTTTKPSGELRITAPVGLGTVWVTQRLREFMELYPEIRIDLNLERRPDRHLDASRRRCDRTREPEHADLIRRPLFTMKVRAYASTSYVRRFGAPQTLRDLDKHRIVSDSGHPAQHLSAITWIETVGRDGLPPRDAPFKVNSVVAMKYAIRAGLGVGMIPDYLTEGETDLVTVLTENRPTEHADPVCLPGGVEDIQESASIARFPCRESQAVERLRVEGRRVRVSASVAPIYPGGMLPIGIFLQSSGA